MRKFWTILFTFIISANQVFALQCEAFCEVAEKANFSEESNHECCPNSKKQDENKKTDGCSGHELFGKCFHEEISTNIESDDWNEIKRFGDIQDYVSVKKLDLPNYFSTSSRSFDRYKYQRFKLYRNIYIDQEKLLI